MPSCTTVLKVLDKPALVQWAANSTTEYLATVWKPGIAYDEIEIKKHLQSARFKFRSISDEAKDVGTLVHNWIEGFLQGREQELPWNEQARRACQAALKWNLEHKFRSHRIETRLYSRKYKIAGTMDLGAVGEVDGRKAIVDWKTSKNFFPEYSFQTAFYSHTVKEMYSESTFADRIIVRLDKQTGEVESRWLPAKDLQKDLAVVVACRKIYERMKEF